MRAIPAVALAAVLLAATEARGQWPAGGKQVADFGPLSRGLGHVRMFDVPTGGHYIMCGAQYSTYLDYRVTRMDGDGEALPGYPAYADLGGMNQSISPEMRGFAVNETGQFLYSAPSVPGAVPAGTVVQYVALDGALLPNSIGWILNSSGFSSAIAPGAVGDAYVLVGSNRLRRMLGSGVQSPTWPASGVNVATETYLNAALIEDGSGGVVWFLPFGSALRPCALRVDSTGLRHTGWPTTGELVISDDPQDQEFDLEFETSYIRQPLIRSGDNHCIAAWSKRPGNTPRHIKLQRFSMDGAVDPSWPSGGLLIAQPVDSAGVTLLPDGAGGAFVLWYQNGWPVGTHVLASGQILGAPATSLLPPGASYVRSRVKPGMPSRPINYVMADVTPSGDVVFAWEDVSAPGVPQIRVRWLLPDLTPDPAEPSAGRLVLPTMPGGGRTVGGLRVVKADDVGGALVGWEMFHILNEAQPDFWNIELWMTRLLPSALVDAPRATPGTSAIALSAPRPNPARDAISLELTLAADAPAKLELLDVAGRSLRAQTVEGAGRHSLAFTRLRDLPPGLYFVSATANGESQRARVVLTR